MVQLADILNTFALGEHIKAGNVSARQNDSGTLTILNYTAQCQYERNWDNVTIKCRGLIYDNATGDVVARPFPKFFNWDESGTPYPPAGPALRMEKMDGSLGILYSNDYDNGEAMGECIATRGSFNSEQATWATEFYWSVVMDQINNTGEAFGALEGKTYLFEIIYPENRIVVDYGDYKGLVLLDVIDNKTGFSDTDEFDNCNWPDKVRRIPVPGFDSGQTVDIPDGDEGFVYLWPTRNFRTKMKSAEYVRIHRLVSGLTAKSIWQHLVNGGTLDSLKKDLPEEFHEFIDSVARELVTKASAIVNEVYLIIDQIEADLGERYDMVTRKEFAMQANKYPDYRQYLFLVLDGKPVYPVALKNVKPQREVSLVKED